MVAHLILKPLMIVPQPRYNRLEMGKVGFMSRVITLAVLRLRYKTVKTTQFTVYIFILRSYFYLLLNVDVVIIFFNCLT